MQGERRDCKSEMKLLAASHSKRIEGAGMHGNGENDEDEREREIKKLLLMLMEERRRGEGKLKTNCELIEKFKTNHGFAGSERQEREM